MLFNLFKSKSAKATSTLSDEHRENVAYYLAGQPIEEEVLELTDDMMIKPEPKTIMIHSTWDHKHCAAIGCTKALEGCCVAYKNPAILPWFRQGKECPTGPYQADPTKLSTKDRAKLNPIKASKRNTK
jgi:hypothetical protein